MPGIGHAGDERLGGEHRVDAAGLDDVGHGRERHLDEIHALGIDAFLDQPFHEQHMQEGAEPGRADFLADEILGLLDGDAVADEGRDGAVRRRVHDRGAGDRDEIEPAVDGLQEHRRGRPADLDRIGEDRGRDVRVDADQHHLGVEPMLFEDAFVDRDHRGGAVGGRGAADLDLRLGRAGLRAQAMSATAECDGQSSSSIVFNCLPFAFSYLDYRYFI